MLLILITKKNSIRFSVAIKNRTEVFFFFFLFFFSLRPLSSFLQKVSCFWAIASARRVENRTDAEKSKSGSNSYWYPVLIVISPSQRSYYVNYLCVALLAKYTPGFVELHTFTFFFSFLFFNFKN